MPQVVKNLLIINGLFFLATYVVQQVYHENLNQVLGMYYFESESFRPYQLVTYMFMHGGLYHILTNMFMLWMFGSNIENVWGPKRFLTYYLITGVGASLFHFGIDFYQVSSVMSNLTPDMIEIVKSEGANVLQQGMNYNNPDMAELNQLLNVPLVGASGAVFGILLAFGMLFPNLRIIPLFFPIPIKAKYMVMFFGAFELYVAFQNSPGDNIAHFAHLGGMLFGYLLIKYWKADTPIY
ncbi:rhomboid family intramembrane serine protease [bacterium SCSIO 12741]|nr:rhomboid family intramembrane serine protease [bacterium SCSIO 12741]